MFEGIYLASPGTLADGQQQQPLLDSTGNLKTTTGGAVADATTASGNPVPVGAVYKSTRPIYTDGQRTALQTDTRGNLAVSLVAFGGGSTNGISDANGLAVTSGLSSTFWNYAAATGGIVNTTTAVTIKTAAGASVRNYLKSLEISHDALGAATEIAIRDGAAGTVLWRGKLQTTAIDSCGGAGTITFDPPLKGAANTLMEVVTLTAVTGGVFVNAQGFTGS